MADPTHTAKRDFCDATRTNEGTFEQIRRELYLGGWRTIYDEEAGRWTTACGSCVPVVKEANQRHLEAEVNRERGDSVIVGGCVGARETE